MTREESFLMMIGGSIAISLSVFPFLSTVIFQIKKAYSSQDYGDFSIIGAIFWSYFVQLLATMVTIFGFYLYDILNKASTYKMVATDGLLYKFWKVSQSDITSTSSEEVVNNIYSMVIIKDWFTAINGWLPFIVAMMGFIGGVYFSQKNNTRHEKGHIKTMFEGAIGGILMYILYIAYAYISQESLFISTSLVEMAQDYWK